MPQVDITSNTYLAAVAGGGASRRSGGGSSLLAKHRAEMAEYMRPAVAVAAAESVALRGASEAAELRASLQTLRDSLLTSLESRREALKVADWYQAWHVKSKKAAAEPSSGGRSDPSVVEVAAAPAAPSPPSSREGEAGRGAEEDDGRRRVAALLAAIDAAMLGLRLDVLGRHAGFPFHFATKVPGAGAVPAAEWMHAVLK